MKGLVSNLLFILKQFNSVLKEKKIELGVPIHLKKIDFACQMGYHISLAIRKSFFLPKQLQNLDWSYKTDLSLLDCLGKVKLVL